MDALQAHHAATLRKYLCPWPSPVAIHHSSMLSRWKNGLRCLSAHSWIIGLVFVFSCPAPECVHCQSIQHRAADCRDDSIARTSPETLLLGRPGLFLQLRRPMGGIGGATQLCCRVASDARPCQRCMACRLHCRQERRRSTKECCGDAFAVHDQVGVRLQRSSQPVMWQRAAKNRGQIGECAGVDAGW